MLQMKMSMIQLLTKKKNIFRIIVLIVFVCSNIEVVAQSDYYMQQARSYQREVEYYTKQAKGYDREVDYYNRQTQGYLREAEYYSKREKYEQVR